jgi:hypothetical protein
MPKLTATIRERHNNLHLGSLKASKSLTRRSAIKLFFGGCVAPAAIANGSARETPERESINMPAASCLPAVLYDSAPSASAISNLRSEIARERPLQPEYYANAQPFLARLATAAARLSGSLELSPRQRPEILLAASRSWRTVDRRFSDNEKEIIFLSKTDTLPSGNAPPLENMLFAILAHEFGHVYQFVRQFNYADKSIAGPTGSRPIRELELHADFMAGFGLARSEEKYGRPDDLLRRFSDTILNLGDYNFAPCLHHGTPAERYTMMMKGYIEAQRDQKTSAHAASGVAFDLLTNRVTDVKPSFREHDVCKY